MNPARTSVSQEIFQRVAVAVRDGGEQALFTVPAALDALLGEAVTLTETVARWEAGSAPREQVTQAVDATLAAVEGFATHQHSRSRTSRSQWLCGLARRVGLKLVEICPQSLLMDPAAWEAIRPADDAWRNAATAFEIGATDDAADVLCLTFAYLLAWRRILAAWLLNGARA